MRVRVNHADVLPRLPDRVCTLVVAVLHLTLSARAIIKLCQLVPRLLHAHATVTAQEMATRYAAAPHGWAALRHLS